MWGSFNPVQTLNAAGRMPMDQPWFPAQHLAYWNDAVAESPLTETMVNGEIVGWASRHPVGSPTGKRGVVNITESEWTDASAKWVFDWVTSQGNGTFQSVGWTRIDEEYGNPKAAWPEDDQISIENQSVAGSYSTMRGCLWWDEFSGLWNLIEQVAGNNARVVSVDPSGGVTTPICDLASPGDWYTRVPAGLARIGTDIIVSGIESSTAFIARYTSAGVLVWNRADSIGSYKYHNDVTIDGSGLPWTAGEDGNIRKHSASDGTITTTVTLAEAPASLNGIAYDPADGYFWVKSEDRGLWKVDGVTGATIVTAPQFSFMASQQYKASTAPYEGNYAIPQSGTNEPYSLSYWYGTYGTQAMTSVSNVLGGDAVDDYACLVVKGTDLMIGYNASSPIHCTNRVSLVRGHTLGTRSLLANPVTKTSAQTLKITYQFNFS
jgi:hypothetical protein